MICENCKKEHDGSYGSGRFCSSKCARGFSTKLKRHEINEKVRKTLTKHEKFIETRICPVCNNSFDTLNINIKTCCSSKCGSIYGGRLNKDKIYSNHFSKIVLICKECNQSFEVNWNKRFQQFCCNDCRHKNKEYLSKISIKMKERCSTLEAKKRLRDIGRKGGFGKKGKTSNGIQYSSNLEKDCFEWLVDNNVKFEHHKYLPNSSKVSDVYLIENDIWIELDGINREKKKKWLKKDYEYWMDKLKLYNELNMNYKIIYSFKEFKDFINELMGV